MGMFTVERLYSSRPRSTHLRAGLSLFLCALISCSVAETFCTAKRDCLQQTSRFATVKHPVGNFTGSSARSTTTSLPLCLDFLHSSRLAIRRLPLLNTMGIIQYSSEALRKLACNSIPNCVDVIKSFGLLRRPKYMHRGSRRKFVYSNSAIPTIQSATGTFSGILRHHNKSSMCTRKLRPLLCVDTPIPPMQKTFAAHFMLSNVQSLNNKPLLIHDYIKEREIGICCLVETWQNTNDFVALNIATPPGYAYLQKSRLQGGGGGVAIIYRDDIPIKELTIPAVTSFEFIVFKLAQHQVVLIYRSENSELLLQGGQ